MTSTEKTDDLKIEQRSGSRGWFQLALDWLYGFDYFISYRWKDGREYALDLAKKLEDSGFACFLDSKDSIKGRSWKDIGTRALAKTSRLILVASPKAVYPEPYLSLIHI